MLSCLVKESVSLLCSVLCLAVVQKSEKVREGLRGLQLRFLKTGCLGFVQLIRDVTAKHCPQDWEGLA